MKCCNLKTFSCSISLLLAVAPWLSFSCRQDSRNPFLFGNSLKPKLGCSFHLLVTIEMIKKNLWWDRGKLVVVQTISMHWLLVYQDCFSRVRWRVLAKRKCRINWFWLFIWLDGSCSQVESRLRGEWEWESEWSVMEKEHMSWCF